MFITTDSGEIREIRAAGAAVTLDYIKQFSGSSLTLSGATDNDIYGVAAVARCIQLLSEVISSMEPEVVELVDGIWQVDQNAPELEVFEHINQFYTPVEWLDQTVTALEGTGNSLNQIIRDKRGRAVEIYPLQPGTCLLVERGGKIGYEMTVNGKRNFLDPADVLHIVGWTTTPGVHWGVSRIELHRRTLEARESAVRQDKAMADNASLVPMVITIPKEVNGEQAKAVLAGFDALHGGPENYGKPAVLGAGMDLKPIAMNRRDAQWVEQQHFGLLEVGNIWGIRPTMLGLSSQGTSWASQDEKDYFAKFNIEPRVTKIVSAINKHPAFGFSRTRRLRLRASSSLMPDYVTQHQTMATTVNAGIYTPNEARAELGKPRLPGDIGDIIQVVPVGGAPDGVTLPGQGA